jgi:outer membrane protein assembly factor BamA
MINSETVSSLLSISRVAIFLNAGSIGGGNIYGHNDGNKNKNKFGFGNNYPFRLLDFGIPRMSIGAAYSLNLGAMKLELSYSVPMVSAPQDVVKPFQIGLGLNWG